MTSNSSGSQPATGQRRPLVRRPLFWILTAVVVVALAVTAVIVGSKLYADQQNQAAPAEFSQTTAPIAAATPSAGEVEGNWAISSGSQAGYRVHEILNGQNVTVVGRTNKVTGGAQAQGSQMTKANITVDLDSVATDSHGRDKYFRSKALDTSEFPNATFTLTQPADLASLGSGGAEKVQMVGDLTIKGVTKKVTLDAQATLGADRKITVIGSIPIQWSDFGIQAPDLGFVKVDSSGSVEFSLVLTKS